MKGKRLTALLTQTDLHYNIKSVVSVEFKQGPCCERGVFI